MLTRRIALASLSAAFFALLQKAFGEDVDSAVATTETKQLYLHVYSNHHKWTHDPDKKKPEKHDFHNPSWTRVLSFLLVPNVAYYLRVPGNRDPDIELKGRIKVLENGKLDSALEIDVDDTNMTHRNKFEGEIVLDQIHKASDPSFRYIFSSNIDPYVVLSIANGSDE